jgi:hypothetical protein
MTCTVGCPSFQFHAYSLTTFAGTQGLKLVQKSELDSLLLNDVR